MGTGFGKLARAQQAHAPDRLIESLFEVCAVFEAFRFKFGVTAKPGGR